MVVNVHNAMHELLLKTFTLLDSVCFGPETKALKSQR